MKITIETIPHENQRYPTVGDWVIHENGDILILVSEMDNINYSFLVGIHEAIEAWLCRERGISETDVTNFDLKFEAERLALHYNNDAEPGFDVRAPYYKEHVFATYIESKLAEQLGINWEEYSDTINSL